MGMKSEVEDALGFEVLAAGLVNDPVQFIELLKSIIHEAEMVDGFDAFAAEAMMHPLLSVAKGDVDQELDRMLAANDLADRLCQMGRMALQAVVTSRKLATLAARPKGGA